MNLGLLGLVATMKTDTIAVLEREGCLRPLYFRAQYILG